MYPDAYEHMYRIRDKILESEKFRYAQRFDWEVKIIHKDDVLNAFAAPGGYMYFYTGLIRFGRRVAICRCGGSRDGACR